LLSDDDVLTEIVLDDATVFYACCGDTITRADQAVDDSLMLFGPAPEVTGACFTDSTLFILE